MKKILFMLVAVMLLLVGCGGEDSSEHKENDKQDASTEQQENNKPTQEELDAKLKKEAIEADFVAINGGEVEDGTKLYADGTVDLILEEGAIDTFSFSTDDGLYTVKSLDIDSTVSEGDFIRVYGTYAGKEEGTGIPLLSVTVIEPIENELDPKSEAEANAAKHPARPGAMLYDKTESKLKGMNYYFKGELVKVEKVEGSFGNMEDAFLVKNENGYVMPIFPPYEIEAAVSDEIEAWGPLSGDGYASSDLGVDNVVGVAGAMNASQVSVNGEMK